MYKDKIATSKDEALEFLNNEFCFIASPRVEGMKVWIAMWSYPGCLPESRCYCATKEEAIEACKYFFDHIELPPGVKTQLRNDNFAYVPEFENGMPMHVEIAKVSIGDLL